MDACPRCGHPLAPEALVCPSCHALRYASDLERLRVRAESESAARRYSTSRRTWTEALTYLPPESRQAAWVVGRINELSGLEDETDASGAAVVARARTPGWVARLGPVAPIALALLKGKGLLALFNAKTLLTLGAFMGYYAQVFGAAFGVGFALLILVHELGHVIDVRRRGLPADMPVFLPGLGAYVRWRALGVSDVVRAEVSLAGPLAGLIAAIACAAVWWTTGSALAAALARAGAWLNVLNLTPIWVLDGGQAAGVLDRTQRLLVLCAALSLWMLFGEGAFLIVAIGAAIRMFMRETPAEPSARTAVYFVSVLAGLGIVIHLMPGVGAAIP